MLGMHQETGRSMVETLGVLAVMGLLSIVGVMAYRYAIDRMNASGIIDEVRKRAVVASQQRILGQSIDLSEYGDNAIQGHPVTPADNYEGDSSFFTLTISGVPNGCVIMSFAKRCLLPLRKKSAVYRLWMA